MIDETKLILHAVDLGLEKNVKKNHSTSYGSIFLHFNIIKLVMTVY